MMRCLYIVLAIGFLLSACVKRDDALAPMISITEPKNGAVKSADALRIVGYAMDDMGIQALRVEGNDLFASEFLKNERGKKLVQFAFRPNLIREGQWGALIEAEDKSGRVSTLRYQLDIDATAPSLKVMRPEKLANGRLRVSGVARDNRLLERIVVNGVDVSFSPAREKFFTIDIEAADEVLTVVYDEAGNMRSWENAP
ncbi:MAG: hypothetical protein R2880_07865 [Deinococcales bacterium]